MRPHSRLVSTSSAAITQRGEVDPDSNYCFGEGGAGTYSDGKLYTRSGKREDIARILATFVAYGASPDILVEAHPHIGTNKLPDIITAIVNGRKPPQLTAQTLMRLTPRLPTDWAEQRKLLGFH